MGTYKLESKKTLRIFIISEASSTQLDDIAVDCDLNVLD